MFIIVPDLTERTVQQCVKLGITADFSADSQARVKTDGCNDVTSKNEGLFSS